MGVLNSKFFKTVFLLGFIYGYFLCLSAHGGESSLCSRSLEGESNRLFVDAVIYLHQQGILEASDIRLILEDPASVLGVLGEGTTRSLAFVEILEKALKKGLERQQVAEFLRDYLRIVENDDSSRVKNESKTRGLLGLSELDTPYGRRVMERYPVWVEREGEKVLALVHKSGASKRINLVDPVSGVVRQQIQIEGVSQLDCVLDAIETDSGTFLIVGAWRTVVNASDRTEHLLLLYDLTRTRVVDQVRMSGFSRVLQVRQIEDRLIAFGALSGDRKKFVVVEFASRTSQAKVNIIQTEEWIELERPKQFDQGLFFHEGELHLAFVGRYWYQVINLERAQRVVERKFSRRLSAPLVIKTKSGRNLAVMSCQEAEICVFDPLRPERSRGVARVYNSNLWGFGSGWVSTPFDGRLIWSASIGIVEVNLRNHEMLESLYETENDSRGMVARVFDFLFSGKNSETKVPIDVSQLLKIDADIRVISRELMEVPGISNFDYNGENLLVIDRGELSKGGHGLAILDPESGTILSDLDVRFSEFYPSFLTTTVLHRDEGVYLVAIDFAIKRIRVFTLVK